MLRLEGGFVGRGVAGAGAGVAGGPRPDRCVVAGGRCGCGIARGAVGKRLRAIRRTLGRGSGEAKAELLALTGVTGRLLGASAREARRLAAEARGRARALARAWTAKRRRRAARILAAAERLETLGERSEQVVEQ